MSIHASETAMRIVRTVEARFPTGASKTGSAFVVSRGSVLTCAHVVTNDSGERANRITVTSPTGRRTATMGGVSDAVDLARLDCDDTAHPPEVERAMPSVGSDVVFAGKPQGVRQASVFPGMVSATGTGLLTRPACELIQIAGMVNNGNSGGPLLDAESGRVIGIVTAKYVPLLQEIDRLTSDLEQIPQFPRDVIVGQIDFSAFVNLTIRSMWQVAAVLRLVQVGTGWAIPAQHFDDVR